MSRTLSTSKYILALQRVLADALPPLWTVAISRKDGVEVVWRSPGGDEIRFATTANQELSPGQVKGTLDFLDAVRQDRLALATARYLSPRTREELIARGASFADLTGNVYIASEQPGLLVITHGAQRDPNPRVGQAQTLRGPGAARAVRAILESPTPFGVRELAQRTPASAPTLSRVLKLLERENLIERARQVQEVRRADVVRLWSQDYDVMTTHHSQAFLAPRGLSSVIGRLRGIQSRYAITGAYAAQRFAPIAPARTVTLYVDDIETVQDELRLRPAETGTNVLLIEPFDELVFDSTTESEGITYVAPAQLAVDLLTGTGREPAEGENLLRILDEGTHARWT